MLSSATAVLRSFAPILVPNGAANEARALTAVDALARVSDELDRIEVHERASIRVATLAGTGALVAYDAAVAVRHHLADDSRLGEADAKALAADGLSACGGILRAIVALGDSEVAALARACAGHVASALMVLQEAQNAKLS